MTLLSQKSFSGPEGKGIVCELIKIGSVYEPSLKCNKSKLCYYDFFLFRSKLIVSPIGF